ncbi:MAG: sugar-binding transcriptional regulator [Sporolactobacillus sp.]
MLDKEKDRLSIDVARLYYQSEYSQQQISNQLKLSRPTVSRLLQYAKERGYVTIQIYDPLEDIDSLSDELRVRYHLEHVRVAYSPLDDVKEIRKNIGRLAANVLDEIVQDGDSIGVTWGKTMYSLSTQLKKKHVHDVEVVQLKGGVTHSQVKNYAFEIVQSVASAYNAVVRYLPLPVIFDRPELKQMVEEDRNIKEIIDLGKQANIAVFTVGTVSDDALLFHLGYLKEEEIAQLKKEAVGDICSRFFNKDGEICNPSINRRTIGIELDDLKKKEKRILVAGGEKKVTAIRTALKAGFANVFITDQFTARALLQ